MRVLAIAYGGSPNAAAGRYEYTEVVAKSQASGRRAQLRVRCHKISGSLARIHPQKGASVGTRTKKSHYLEGVSGMVW